MSKFEKKMIPNYLSIFRIILVPVYIAFFFGFEDRSAGLFFAGIVFVVAGATDALDGYLARKNNWITDVGKLIDPLADKLMEMAATICLAIELKGIFTLLAVIIVLKEVVMVVGAWLIMAKQKFYVNSVWFGKAATIIWYIMIAMISFFPAVKNNHIISNTLCLVLLVCMVLTFVMYIKSYKPQIKETKDSIFKEKTSK